MGGYILMLCWVLAIGMLLGALNDLYSRKEDGPKLEERRRVRRNWYDW
jgi:hypothetical protein